MGTESSERDSAHQNPSGGSKSSSTDYADRFVRWFAGKGEDGKAVHKGITFFLVRFLIVLLLIYLAVALLSVVIVIAIPVVLWFLIRFVWRRLAASKPDSDIVLRLSALPPKTRKIGCGVICAFLAIILLGALGSSGSSGSTKAKAAQEALDSAALVENSPLLGTTSNNPYRIEYGSKESGRTTVAVSDLFAPSISEVSLESSSTLDTMSIGEQIAAITLSNSAGSKEVTVRFLVQDTQIPEVQIKEETVSLSQGDEFDPSSNVTAKDSVDGVLSQVDSRPEAKRSSDGAERYESGWFMLSYTDPSGNAVPSIDTSVTGAYRVSAIAYDKNGNCSGDSYFTVVVKATETSAERSAVTEEETAQEEDSTQQSSEQSTSTAAPATHDYVLNTNTKKIHDPGCSSIKKMKEQNKQTVNSTLADLEAQGYEPCNKCHPR